jgi:hypothetical protein
MWKVLLFLCSNNNKCKFCTLRYGWIFSVCNGRSWTTSSVVSETFIFVGFVSVTRSGGLCQMITDNRSRINKSDTIEIIAVND